MPSPATVSKMSGHIGEMIPRPAPNAYPAGVKLERDAVLHIARLARIHLSDDEVDTYAEQLGDIIGHFAVLDRVDTEGVEPTTQALPLRNVMTDDVAHASLPRDEVLALAPNTDDGYLRVRAVLE